MEMPIMHLMKSLERPPGTIDLSQGIPFFGPPEGAIDALKKDILSVERYGPDPGDRALRESIIDKLQDINHIEDLELENVMVTSGANIGFLNAISTICDVGDEVILMNPFYFNHGMTLDLLGVDHVHTNGDIFSIEGIEKAISERTKAVVLVSPNNPTGEVASESFVRELVDLCVKKGIWLVSDETYDMFTYAGNHFSPSSLGKDLPIISLFSMSKGYGMSGYRIGYMVFPKRLYDLILKVQDTTVICPSRIGQALALRCIRDHRNDTRKRILRFEGMRSSVLRWLEYNREYVKAYEPNGAFYCFFRIDDRISKGRNSMDLARTILDEARVLLVPGRPFGADDPPYLRISYGNVNDDDLDEALLRLSLWLRK